MVAKSALIGAVISMPGPKVVVMMWISCKG